MDFFDLVTKTDSSSRGLNLLKDFSFKFLIPLDKMKKFADANEIDWSILTDYDSFAYNHFFYEGEKEGEPSGIELKWKEYYEFAFILLEASALEPEITSYAVEMIVYSLADMTNILPSIDWYEPIEEHEKCIWPLHWFSNHEKVIVLSHDQKKMLSDDYFHNPFDNIPKCEENIRIKKTGDVGSCKCTVVLED